MEGVDISLISDEWFYNHYRWIIWKLAAYEVSLPHQFAGRSLSANNTMLQFKYRYDKEIDQCQRSCIKKIVERDDTPCKRLVLCISDIKENSEANTETVIEVTDGWYCINTSLDVPLLDLVNKRNLVVGQKLITSGAELVGSQDACSPLEIPESLKIKLCFNSTRPASWNSKLGYQCDPRPLCVPLSTLHSEGGNIGSVDIVVARIYPIMYMEKLADRGCVFRTAELEENVSRRHERQKQDILEKLYSKLEKDMESSYNKSSRRRSSRRLKREEIEELTTGEDILEAVEDSLQPEEIQSVLSERQIELMRDYQQKQHEQKQQQLQSEITQAMTDNQQSVVERKVTPLLKIRVIGCAKKDIDNNAATILTIWRPSSEWCQLEEGKRYKLYNLQASSAKSRLESLSVHLTSSRQSRIQQLPIDENLLDVIYESREVWRVADLKLRQPAFKEFDFVGMTFDVENGRKGSMQIAHCIDWEGGFLNITFWTGLKNFGVEDILVVGKSFVACSLILKSSYCNIVTSDVLQEITKISHSSKLIHHRKSLDRFTSLIQDQRNEIVENARSRYRERQNNKMLTKTPEKMYNDLPADLEQFFSPMTEADTSVCSNTDLSPEDIAERNRKSVLRAKASKLMAYGSPSPLSPLNCVVSSAVSKAFKAPIVRQDDS